MMLRLKLAVCTLWVALPLLYLLSPYFSFDIAATAHAAADDRVNYTRDVRPILQASCYRCHAGEKAKAGLRLDTKAAALKGGASGQAIVAGNGHDSLLVKRIAGQSDLGMRMPPGGALSDEQIATLTAWIDQGAEWPDDDPTAATSTTTNQTPATSIATAQQQSANAPDFVKDVQPILQARCYGCHSGAQPRAGLRLDAKEAAMKGGISGRVIVAGDARNSRLIHRVMGEGDEPRMPFKGEPLSSAQIETLRHWIDAGAVWPENAAAAEAKVATHWAFVKPVRPSVPEVKDRAWVRTPVDNFILARLERENLTHASAADKATLLRRVTYDLIGLPPTPAEVDSFLADASPDAYERRVDALLNSPHYGERMAMQWLDLARYADTHGYHIDSRRDMWPWRDWLIKSFNRNMPFDEFTVAQLAGDLLPNATVEQKIASGFNRNHMINFEGGAIPEEYQVEYVIDRVETTSNVWMGMTMGCARCHNHKYDPLTQKEFYQFSAFFNGVSEKGLDGRTGNAAPFLQLPTPAQKTRQDELVAAIKRHEAVLDDKIVDPLQAAWEKTFAGKVAESPRDGLVAHYDLDGNLADVSGRYQHGRTVTGDPTFGAGPVGRSVTFDGDTQVSFGNKVGAFERDRAFTLAFWLRGNNNMPMGLLHKLSDAQTRRGYEMYLDDLQLIGIQKREAQLTIRLTSHWPDDTLVIRTKERLPLGDDSWHQLTLTYDGSGTASGLKLYRNGKLYATEIVTDALRGAIGNTADLQIGDKDFDKPYKGQIDDLRIYDRALAPAEIEQIAVHYPVQTIISGVDGKRTKDETKLARDYYLTYIASDDLRREYAELKQLRKSRDALEKEILTVMVMDEMEKPRDTFVLARGDYRNKTEKVTANVPAILPPLPEGAPHNRLALARWLVSGEHPLTARVAVNRYWQMYFGTGLVKTSEDFGIQGERPVHPELLDWLATEFVRTKWDVRAMQRLIVTSAAYRQTSNTTPALIEKDPENRLLARGPRFRLPAEMVRDNALAASGLLNDAIGGPSVYPYQPKGLWEEMAFGDGFSAQSYTESVGRDLYRRSMYTFWKRAVPPPQLNTFDAPDREKCTSRRALTNTPLQALVLLNDPTYIEAARSLAERALRDGGKDANTQIAYAFRLATARRPSPAETRVLRDLLTQERAHYRRDVKAARDLLSVGASQPSDTPNAGELAAWTTLASAILNLDETITKQ